MNRYVEGLHNGELIGGSCNSCHRTHFYPRYACKYCGSLDIGTVSLPARGRVHTFARVADADRYIAGYDCPYLIVVVLDGGIKLVSRLHLDDDNSAVRCGDRLLPIFAEDKEKGPLLIYRQDRGQAS